MNRRVRLLLCIFLLMAWPGQACTAQCYDLDSYADAMMEVEALIEALDDFGLDLDSPELTDMDGGEIWTYIDYLRRKKVNCEPGNDSDNVTVDKSKTP